MRPAKVSIIVPAFNAEKFICETIKSVQAQTFADWELMIVDDGSSDATAQVVETFLSDKRIQLHRQKNGGVAAARNVALGKTSGEWIAFLDADDVWCPEKLAAQLKVIGDEPETNLVFSNYYLWDGVRDIELRFKTPQKFPTHDFEKRLAYHNLFGMSSVLLKRSALEEIGNFDQEVAPAEDWDLWLRLADHGLHAVGINAPLLRYRVWSGNASKNSLRMGQSNIRVLEKAVQRAVKVRESDYARALQIARGNFELARVSAELSTKSKVTSAGIWRAWQHCPRRVKWLGWAIATSLPFALGGAYWRKRIYKKIQSKW